MSTSTSPNHAIENTVKLVGESFLPGASLLVDGQILTGGAHLLLGAWAKAALGPVGLALVIANSYSTSTTGKSLLKQFAKEGAKEGTKAVAKAETGKVETSTTATA